MVFDPARVGQNCEFCGSPALVSYEEIKAPISPTACCRSASTPARVRDNIRRWWRSKWLAPGRLWRTALVDTVKSLYIPYWTFDAQVHCPWDAEAGHYYYVPVTMTNAQGPAGDAQERRVRWEPASGVVDHFFDDEPVPGTQGLPIDLLKQVEPFPTPEVVPYDTAFLSGHVVEHYRVVLFDAAQQSHDQMTRGAAAALRAAGSRRHLPQPAHLSRVLGPDVQARARAGVAALVHLRRQRVSGDRQRLHRPHRRPLPEEHLEDRAARAAGGRSWRSS